MTNSLQKRTLVRQLHHISGICLSVFIGFHLLGHLFSLAGPEKHIQVTEMFRGVYRNRVVETVLLACVVFQMGTGIRLLFARNAQTPAQKIQVYSGLYLSLFLMAHVSAVLMGRYTEHLDTNFYFAAASLNVYPAPFVFIPYYFLAVTAISLHVASLHYLRTKSAPTAYAIAAVGIITAVLILLGFTDAFRWRDVPAEYRHFIKGFFGE